MAELKTYGDLKKAIKAISLKQKGEKIGSVALDTIVGAIPGLGTAKTTYDFIKAAISKPDTKKTNTWLDKLDIDDSMSKIIDDTVESGFMGAIAKTVENESDDKPLEQDFNMNQKLVDYLKQNYQGRTVTGIKENKMKKSQLKQLIKEEISRTLNENVPALRIFTRKSEEGNLQVNILATTPGWDDKTLVLSVEEAKEMQKLAKEFLGNRNREISKGVNTKDKNFTQSIISIQPLKNMTCALTRKESSIYKGYDEELGSNTGYCVVFQSNVYQLAEDLDKYLTEATPTQQPSDQKLQGSFRSDLFKKLMGSSFDSSKFNSAMNKLKNNQARSASDNAFLGDVVRSLMYTDDNTMLNSIFS